MARIPEVPKGEEGWLLRYAKRFTKKKSGAVLEPAGIMGHSNWVLAGAGAFEMALGRATRVPEKLKMLVDIKVAMQIGCPF